MVRFQRVAATQALNFAAFERQVPSGHTHLEPRDVQSSNPSLDLPFRAQSMPNNPLAAILEVLSGKTGDKGISLGFQRLSQEVSMRGLLRNFGLKVGAISRGRYEHRIREMADGNSMLEAATC